MRTNTKHSTYSIPQSSLISNISKKIVSTDLDSKLLRIEHERDVSVRESSEAGSGYQPVITEKMKNMTTDEIFERLVKENIDFRDYRYNELIKEFEAEMDDFKKQAPTFEELTEANQMQVSQMNPTQVYTQLQTKFYTLRKRDKDDLQERYDRVMKVVRSSHVQEVQNIVSKFKGVLKETIEKKLDEQKLKYELEHKEMRDTHYSMKAQIRSLEEKCEQLQEKINERDKRLQETYDKIMKMNSDNSFRNADQDKLQKLIKEKDTQIEKLQKFEKEVETLEKQKLDYALLIKDKDNTISQKDQLIQKLQKQIQQQTTKINEQDSKLRTLEQQDGRAQSKTTIISDEELLSDLNKRKSTPDQNYQVCRQALLTRNDSRSGQNTSNAKSRPVKQMQQVPIQTFGDVFRKYKQAKRDESQSTKQVIEQLQSKIKIKEDQIKLLSVEVMGLKEECDTYFQNLQTMQNQYMQSNSNSRTQGFSSPAPNLNDLILDPYRRIESSQNNTKSRLSVTEDSRYLSSAFSKTHSQFNNAVSPKLIQLQSVSNKQRSQYTNANADQNKENFQKSAMMNTTDLSMYKTSTSKIGQQEGGNQRQSLKNITNKSTTPDPTKKFGDVHVNFIQNNNNVQNKSTKQAQTVFQNINLQTNNSTQYFSQININQGGTPIIGNRSINITNFNSSNIISSNSINNAQSPTVPNLSGQGPKQKKIIGSYRIQPSYMPTQQSLNNNFVSPGSDSFIPLNL